jgi:hypothetical protein
MLQNCAYATSLILLSDLPWISETTPQGVKKTALAQTLLNGSNIAMVRFSTCNAIALYFNKLLSWCLEVMALRIARQQTLIVYS